MEGKINELADKYFFAIDEQLNDLLSWEDDLYSEDEELNIELILRVKLEIYNSHVEDIKGSLKELKNDKHGF